MLRFSVFIVIVTMLIMPVSGVDIELEVVEIQLSETQRARIVPLYQDFDLFFDLITGETIMADLSREERFIATCAENWFSIADEFGFEVPETVTDRYLEDYRDAADAIPDELLDVVTEALFASSEVLTGADIIVCLSPVNSTETTVAGLSLGGTFTIFIAELDFSEDETNTAVRSLVSHEYHHHVRFNNPETRYSGVILLETLVTEGMAEYFQTLVYPESAQDWVMILDEEDEAYVWSVFEPELRNIDVDTHLDYLFGRIEDLPPLAGYAFGYQVMLAFTENNPDIPVEEWTTMSSEQVYELSGYQPPIIENE